MVSAMIFLIILWEAFVSGRVVLRVVTSRAALEWAHPYPPADHSYDEVPFGLFSLGGRRVRRS